jgi:hypothetical protein
MKKTRPNSSAALQSSDDSSFFDEKSAHGKIRKKSEFLQKQIKTVKNAIITIDAYLSIVFYLVAL